MSQFNPSSVREKVEALENELGKAALGNKILADNVDALATSLANAKAERDAALKKVESLEIACGELEAKVIVLKASQSQNCLEGMALQNEELKNRLAKRGQRITQLSQQIAALQRARSENEQLKTEIETLKMAAAGAEHYLDELKREQEKTKLWQEESQRLETKYGCLEVVLMKEKSKSARLEEKIKELKSENNMLNFAYEKERCQVSYCFDEIKKRDDRIAEFESGEEVKKLRARCDRLLAEIGRQEQAVISMREDYNKLAGDYVELGRQKEALQATADLDLKQIVAQLVEAHRTLADKVAAIEACNDSESEWRQM